MMSRVQVTLVDCPGHASLIRTIIGGAQIIDMMLMVVDITKGIQVCPACTTLHAIMFALQFLNRPIRPCLAPICDCDCAKLVWLWVHEGHAQCHTGFAKSPFWRHAG